MSKKLCKLVSDGFLDDHTKKYTQMVNNPKYVCMKCGRAANDEDSLCRPKKIKDKKEDRAEAKNVAEKASKKEAKKTVHKSEGYQQISEDLANEKLMKFDEKIQKRIVKVSKSALRHKKNPTDKVASVGVGDESEIETEVGLETDVEVGFKTEDVE